MAAAQLTEATLIAALSDHSTKLGYLNHQQMALSDAVADIQAELQKISSQSAGRGGGHARYLVDLKHMSPEKYTGPRGNVPFRQWAQDLKDLCSRYSQDLLSSMIQVEHNTERISQEQIERAGISQDEDAQLRSALRAFTQGEPRAFINTAIDRGDFGLEIWRTLVSLYDPDNDTTRMDESQFIMNPGKAKSLGDVQSILSRWEDTLNHRSRTLGKAPLDDDLKRSVLLRLLPDAEEKEMRNQRVLYKTFEALRTRILEMINERTRGPAAMIYHVAEEEYEDCDEDSEWIMSIQGRGKAKGKGKGKGKAKGGKGEDSRECYRCGRFGHIRPNCTAKGHASGGPCKEMKKRIGNLEEEDEGEECTSLDICMFEVDDDYSNKPNPFLVEKRPLVMKNPFKGQKSTFCDGNPFTKRQSGAVDNNPWVLGGVKSGGHGGEGQAQSVGPFCSSLFGSNEVPAQRSQPVFNRWSGEKTEERMKNMFDFHSPVELHATPPPQNSYIPPNTPEATKTPTLKHCKPAKTQVSTSSGRLFFKDSFLEDDEYGRPFVMDPLEPVKVLSSSTRQAALYSLKSLQGIAEKTAKDLCSKVRASMELIIENTVEEMEREMRDQEVFRFHSVDGWEPIDEYIDETAEDDFHARSTSGDHGELPSSSDIHARSTSGGHDEQPSSSFDANALNVEELDLMAVDNMQVDGGYGWEKIDVTVDSGAAHSVADGSLCWPTVRLDESEGSRAGSVYLGPGKERIPNRGQKSLNVRTAGSEAVRRMTFQDAPVRKPLAAVSGITDKGNVVLFDRKGSFIAPEDAPEVQTIRELIKQVKNRIELERRKGVYIMPIWVQTDGPRSKPTSVFIGQGK
jgi:hypothetical protein